MIGDEKDWAILFGDLATAQMARVRDSIVSLSVSYSTSMCTQLTIEMIDVNFEMLKSNYFIVGRDIVYRSKSFPTTGDMNIQLADRTGNLIHLFEIASVEVRPSNGSSPAISIQARTKSVQQMKRDKNPGNIKGKSSDYVNFASLLYGLKPLIQKTSKSRQITKASGDRQADSTWDVLSNLASDSKYMLFETDGMLFFCSMDFLMGRWGIEQINNPGYTNSRNEPMPGRLNVVPLKWTGSDTKQTGTNELALIPMAMPTVRRSDNDPFVVSGTASVDRVAGTFLRPGMTLHLQGMPTFEDVYMITSVAFDHFSGNPVSIEFSKPEREGKYVQNYAVGPIFADYGTTTENSPLVNKLRII